MINPRVIADSKISRAMRAPPGGEAVESAAAATVKSWPYDFDFAAPGQCAARSATTNAAQVGVNEASAGDGGDFGLDLLVA